jgi:hypothetical protein
MEGYARIAEAFRLLAPLSLPLDLAAMELACVNAHARDLKNRRAADRLAKLGPSVAAEIEGCCRRTIYYRAARYSRKCKKAAKACTD